MRLVWRSAASKVAAGLEPLILEVEAIFVELNELRNLIGVDAAFLNR